MRRFLFFLLTCFAFFAATTYAAQVDDLSAQLSALHTMRANFVQTTYDNHGRAVQISQGDMAFSRPGKFRWNVKKPIAQLIITNQSRLIIYDPDLMQVTIRSLGNVAGTTPAILFSQARVDANKDFVVSQLPSQQTDWQWFKLIPRRKDADFAELALGFFHGKLQALRFKDTLGHSSLIQYKNIMTNGDVPNNLFTFKIPAHTDVIDETHQR